VKLTTKARILDQALRVLRLSLFTFLGAIAASSVTGVNKSVIIGAVVVTGETLVRQFVPDNLTTIAKVQPLIEAAKAAESLFATLTPDEEKQITSFVTGLKAKAEPPK
jgi:hypothetical protein